VIPDSQLAGRHEAGVVGEGAGLRVELADIDDIGTDRAGFDGQIDRLVADRDGCGLRHDTCLRFGRLGAA
jgi:hypothetical protein